jgi:hypothetical protein
VQIFIRNKKALSYHSTKLCVGERTNEKLCERHYKSEGILLVLRIFLRPCGAALSKKNPHTALCARIDFAGDYELR